MKVYDLQLLGDNWYNSILETIFMEGPKKLSPGVTLDGKKKFSKKIKFLEQQAKEEPNKPLRFLSWRPSNLKVQFCPIQVLLINISYKAVINSTTPNEVKKPRISDSGEGCFKALGNVLRASSNGTRRGQKCQIAKKGTGRGRGRPRKLVEIKLTPD
ncbi:hypothetical protein BpHYR1_002735 [Brachionus plicatilis]|uniref:Uncharacterized protein n=1 Tax=Brachionus plicatilis TaxID=10195 RepID=A0A3M7PZF6_BRAPC|nr:hypothetical protein BpHYR1_002735 [Brachionus plicatilis]